MTPTDVSSLAGPSVCEGTEGPESCHALGSSPAPSQASVGAVSPAKLDTVQAWGVIPGGSGVALALVCPTVLGEAGGTGTAL